MEKLIPLLFLAAGALAAAGSALRLTRREDVSVQLLRLRRSAAVGSADRAALPHLPSRETAPPSRWRRGLGLLARFTSRLPLRPGELELEKAGAVLTPGEFQAVRLLLLASLSLFTLILGGPALACLTAAPAALFSWYLPYLVLKRRQARRQEAISDALPEVLDLLTLLLHAGQGLKIALPRAAACSHGPLRDEFARVFRSTELGMPRQQAFSLLEERNASEDLRRFVRAAQRAERFGAPLASSMEHLAAEMRHRQKSRLQERAHKAPVKILFPLVFLILPSFLLLTVGGMMLGGRFL